jgi:hypothetical protein
LGRRAERREGVLLDLGLGVRAAAHPAVQVVCQAGGVLGALQE